MKNYELLRKWQKIITRNNPLNMKGRRGEFLRTQSLCQVVPVFVCRHKNSEQIGEPVVGVAVEGKRASFRGLFHCGSPHSCPVCSEFLSMQALHKMQALVEHRDSLGEKGFMATFTVPHLKWHSADYVYELLKKSWHSWQTNKHWKRIKKELGISGFIRNVECTDTANGYHFHYHVVYFMKANSIKDVQKVAEYEEELQNMWTTSVVGVATRRGQNFDYLTKYDGNLKATPQKGLVISKTDKGAIRIVDAKYLAKGWGVAGEMTRSFGKATHLSTSRQMFELLESDDEKDNKRFYAYARTMAGVPKLLGTPKLMHDLPYSELTLEELYDMLTAKGDFEKKSITVAWFLLVDWLVIIEKEGQTDTNYRAGILRAAVQGGFDYVYGYCQQNQLPLPLAENPHNDTKKKYKRRYYGLQKFTRARAC